MVRLLVMTPAVQLTLLLALAGAPQKGCQFSGDTVPERPNGSAGGDNGSGTGGTLWRAVPVDLRVYPSTRFIREENEPILEARLELFDEMGDSVKGAGKVFLELYAGDREGAREIGRRLYTWNLTLETLEDQRKYYDPITRAYLFRLKVDNLQVARRTTTLYVTLMQPGGKRLQAYMVLQRRRPVTVSPKPNE
jgi:hypothetical protein